MALINFFSKKILLTNTDHKKTAINVLIAFFIRLLGAGMAFIFNLVIVKYLGAEQSGYFFLAFAIIMFLSAFSRLGFDNTILRFTGISFKSQQFNSIFAILRFAFSYVMPVALFISILLYLIAEPVAVYIFSKPEMTTTLKTAAPAIFGISVTTLLAMSLQAQQRLPSSICCQNILHLILTLIAIFYFEISTSVEVSAVFSGCLILSSLIFYRIWLKRLTNTTFQKSEVLINKKEILRSANSNWLSIMMTQVIQWIGPLITGIWLMAEDVAYLSVAMRVAMLTSFILMAINLVVAPKFAALHASGDIKGLRSMALFSVRLLIITSIPIVLIMFLFPEVLMGLFGNDFVSASGLLQILVLGQFINVITGSVGYLLIMSGHERDLVNITLLSGIIMVVLTLSFTKSFGVTGCAVAIALCTSFQNLFAVYYVRKRLGFNTLLFWQKI